MNTQRSYKDTIWTNHALQRLQERNVKQGDAWATWSKPDNSRYSSSQGGWVYTRTWGTERIEVVAKQNEKGEWIILSVWGKSVTPQKLIKKTSLLKKIFTFLFPKN